jgi:hypothetical protein
MEGKVLLCTRWKHMIRQLKHMKMDLKWHLVQDLSQPATSETLAARYSLFLTGPQLFPKKLENVVFQGKKLNIIDIKLDDTDFSVVENKTSRFCKAFQGLDDEFTELFEVSFSPSSSSPPVSLGYLLLGYFNLNKLNDSPEDKYLVFLNGLRLPEEQRMGDFKTFKIPSRALFAERDAVDKRLRAIFVLDARAGLSFGFGKFNLSQTSLEILDKCDFISQNYKATGKCKVMEKAMRWVRDDALDYCQVESGYDEHGNQQFNEYSGFVGDKKAKKGSILRVGDWIECNNLIGKITSIYYKVDEINSARRKPRLMIMDPWLNRLEEITPSEIVLRKYWPSETSEEKIRAQYQLPSQLGFLDNKWTFTVGETLDTEIRVTRGGRYKIPIAAEIMDNFKVVARIGDVELTCTRSMEKEKTHIFKLHGTVPNFPDEYEMIISLLPKSPGQSLFKPILLSQKIVTQYPKFEGLQWKINGHADKSSLDNGIFIEGMGETARMSSGLKKQ